MKKVRVLFKTHEPTAAWIVMNVSLNSLNQEDSRGFVSRDRIGREESITQTLRSRPYGSTKLQAAAWHCAADLASLLQLLEPQRG